MSKTPAAAAWDAPAQEGVSSNVTSQPHRNAEVDAMIATVHAELDQDAANCARSASFCERVARLARDTKCRRIEPTRHVQGAAADRRRDARADDHRRRSPPVRASRTAGCILPHGLPKRSASNTVAARGWANATVLCSAEGRRRARCRRGSQHSFPRPYRAAGERSHGQMRLSQRTFTKILAGTSNSHSSRIIMATGHREAHACQPCRR
jgi:hypothetical protein